MNQEPDVAYREPRSTRAGRWLRPVSFGLKPGGAVGLAFGPRCLRIARGRWTGGQFEILHLDEICVATDVRFDEGLRDVLLNASLALDLRNADVTSVLSEEQIHAKSILLNPTRSRELPEAIRLAMCAAHPEIAQAKQVIAHEERGLTTVGGTPRYRYMGVCAPESDASRLCDGLREARVYDPQIVPDFAAIENLVRRDRTLCGERPTIVLQMGVSCSVLHVFRKGRFEDRYVIKVGYDQIVTSLTEAITLPGGATARLSRERVVRLLASYGIDSDVDLPGPGDVQIPADRFHGLLRPQLERLVRDISKWIRHYQVETMCAAPKEILVCGEGTRIEGLLEFIQKYMSIETRRLDPTVGVHADREQLDSRVAGACLSTYAVAIGAAMQLAPRFPLVPPAQSSRILQGVLRRSVRLLVAAAAVFVVWLSLTMRFVSGDLGEAVARTEADLAALQEPLEMLAVRDALREELKNVDARLEGLVTNPVRVAETLREIALHVPGSIVLDDVSFDLERDPNRVVMRGRAEGESLERDIAAFLADLDHSPRFLSTELLRSGWPGTEAAGSFEIRARLSPLDAAIPCGVTNEEKKR